MKESVLISGGSGLVGTRLTKLLVNKGYRVVHLSRNSSNKTIETIEWDVDNMKIDANSIEEFDHIINLTGAGIVDKAWTKERKQVLIDSRVKSVQLLKEAISSNKKKPKTFTSASAIGYYGMQTKEKIFNEKDKAGIDFLAETCILWENAINELNEINVSPATIRVGVVLSAKDGALKELSNPIRYGIGAPLGSGKQYIPWIHIDDLCNLFIHAMENNLKGVLNAVSPNQNTNASFTKILAKVLRKPLFLPNVPGFLLKLLLGGRAILILEGSRISSKKAIESGFEFNYTDLESALKNLYA